MNETLAPLPSQLSTTDDSPYITIKSPTCCKYNFSKAIHDVVAHKISEEKSDSYGEDEEDEEDKHSTGNNDVMTCSLSNCCKCNSSETKDVLVDKEGRLINWGVARASHPIPSTCNLYYFEVKIVNDGKTKEIEIGIATDTLNYINIVEWNNGRRCIGYRGNDGKLYEWIEYVGKEYDGKEYGPTFEIGDVIGCGVNLQTKGVFFTKNGMIIGLTNEYFEDNKTWFPAVSLHAKNAKVELNFGEHVFMFDICKYLSVFKFVQIQHYNMISKIYFSS